MTFLIRECRISDAKTIHALNAQELGYLCSMELTRKKLEKALCSDSDRIFVAEIGGEVVGYVHACDYELLYYPSMKNIMGIAVNKNYQRMGIGKALLQAVENWAEDTDCAGVRLVSGAERADAHRFYQDCGYSYGKDQKNFKKLL